MYPKSERPRRDAALVVTAIGLIAALAGACGSDVATEPGCIEGDTQLCICEGGSAGIQACGADHAFGVCSCSAVDMGVDATTQDTSTGQDVADAGVSDSATADTAPNQDSSTQDSGTPDVISDDTGGADTTTSDSTIGDDTGIADTGTGTDAGSDTNLLDTPDAPPINYSPQTFGVVAGGGIVDSSDHTFYVSLGGPAITGAADSSNHSYWIGASWLRTR